LQKLVQYIWRYSTKYAKPPRTRNAISIRLFSTETTGLIFTKILYDIVTIVALFNHAYTRHYPILFLKARATKMRSLPSFLTKSIAISTTLEISKKRVQIDYLHPKRFHSVKTCENRSSTFDKIRQIRREHVDAISICYLVLRQNYWTDLHQNFTRYSGSSAGIKSCIHKALVHSSSECQSKE